MQLGNGSGRVERRTGRFNPSTKAKSSRREGLRTNVPALSHDYAEEEHDEEGAGR